MIFVDNSRLFFQSSRNTLANALRIDSARVIIALVKIKAVCTLAQGLRYSKRGLKVMSPFPKTE